MLTTLDIHRGIKLSPKWSCRRSTRSPHLCITLSRYISLSRLPPHKIMLRRQAAVNTAKAKNLKLQPAANVSNESSTGKRRLRANRSNDFEEQPSRLRLTYNVSDESSAATLLSNSTRNSRKSRMSQPYRQPCRRLGESAPTLSLCRSTQSSPLLGICARKSSPRMTSQSWQ